MKMLGKSASLLVSFGLLAVPAVAQDMRTASEKVVACQAIEDGAARLECFETAAMELSAILAQPVPQVATAPEPATVPAAPTEVAAVASPAPVAETPAPIQVASATAAAPEAATEAPTEADGPTGSRLPSWIPRITFGGDRDVEKEPDEFRTTITRIQRNNLGRHFFTTAEGQVWRQTDIGDIRAPKTLPAEVILSQNIMGGIRLKIVGINRLYSVTRVE
mgnify:FL=1